MTTSIPIPDTPAAAGANTITAKMRRVRPPVIPVRPVETISVARYQEMIRPAPPASEFPKGDVSKLKLIPENLCKYHFQSPRNARRDRLSSQFLPSKPMKQKERNQSIYTGSEQNEAASR